MNIAHTIGKKIVRIMNSTKVRPKIYEQHIFKGKEANNIENCCKDIGVWKI